jgi:molybdopterin-biosynthesis enzyme MoeA-like protein
MVFNAMLDSIVPELEGSPPLKSYSLRVALGEGDLGTALGELNQRHPEVQIGSYPFFNSSGNGVTIVARSTDQQALDVCVNDLRELLRKLGATDIQETKL